MKQEKKNNYAFIDSQNLNLAIRGLGWKLHFKSFRIYLKEKYQVDKAFLFIGYIKENEPLYESLKKDGFRLIFKPTLIRKEGTKGNVDAELVLHTMIEWNNFDKAVIVTGDGDFHCLVEYLVKKNKLEQLLIPNKASYSLLLKRFDPKYLSFISEKKNKLSLQKRKELQKDQPLRSAFRRDSKESIQKSRQKVKRRKR